MMRREFVHSVQRLFIIISFAALLGIAAVSARVFGVNFPLVDDGTRQGLVLAAFDRTIALVSGHSGYDSGAVCLDDDGAVTLTEADVNAQVTDLAARRLRRAGADVIVLEEYDPRLEGLEADVLLSIHADSCVEATGYKAAYYTDSRIPFTGDRMLACIDEYYAGASGLPHHRNSVTHDMTEYHAFRRVAVGTPAAILEIGFLGGDQKLLTHEPERIARGIADSLLCFLQDEADVPDK